VFLISTLGMGLGSWSGGWLYDHLGSYAWLYGGSFVIGATAVVLALSFRPPRPVTALTPLPVSR
jgi:predicted MFS family arabinose efflux permease